MGDRGDGRDSGERGGLPRLTPLKRYPQRGRPVGVGDCPYVPRRENFLLHSAQSQVCCSSFDRCVFSWPWRSLFVLYAFGQNLHCEKNDQARWRFGR